jgi:oxepin-CoA hydrolase/3-oxo-5,6-dehydrosuberyl-CoA semialdehyde dehydrogenase
MNMRLKSFVNSEWLEGDGKLVTLLNPATEEPLAETTTSGINFSAALEHARSVGGPALRSMTFAERAEILQAIYDVL